MTAGPIHALAGTSDLAAVRYLVACRPYTGCGKGDADIELDALFLTFRK